jgi:hypothetical protein
MFRSLPDRLSQAETAVSNRLDQQTFAGPSRIVSPWAIGSAFPHHHLLGLCGSGDAMLF